MMDKAKIAVYGFSDKRHIFYSLFKILGSIGRVLFITKNPQYLLFTEDFQETEFDVDTIRFKIVNEPISEIFIEETDEINDIFKSYDFVIMDIINDYISQDNQEIAIIVDHLEDYREMIFDTFNDDGERPLVFANKYSGIVSKIETGVNLEYASFVADDINRIETDRLFYPISNNKHIRVMATILREINHCSLSDLKRYLKKKINKKTGVDFE